jgi:hypothetical protein
MSTEVYEPWTFPNLPEPIRLAFDAMHIANGRLTIRLHEMGGARRGAELVFPALPLVVKIVNESHRLNSMGRLPQKREGSLYLVRDSELLEAFNKDALGIYSSDPLRHLAVITDEWIDLVVAELPQLRWTESPRTL